MPSIEPKEKCDERCDCYKIGGVAAQKLSTKFIKQMQDWIAAGKKIVVVHGGGLVINQLMKERQLPTRKVKGVASDS